MLPKDHASPIKVNVKGLAECGSRLSSKTQGIGKADLDITVVGCANLPKMDILGSCDPYVLVQAEGRLFRTRSIPDSVNPEFDETFHARIQRLAKPRKIVLRVMDLDAGNSMIGRVKKDDFVGTCEVSSQELAALIRSDASGDDCESGDLEGTGGKGGDKGEGQAICRSKSLSLDLLDAKGKQVVDEKGAVATVQVLVRIAKDSTPVHPNGDALGRHSTPLILENERPMSEQGANGHSSFSRSHSELYKLPERIRPSCGSLVSMCSVGSAARSGAAMSSCTIVQPVDVLELISLVKLLVDESKERELPLSFLKRSRACTRRLFHSLPFQVM